ncbi:hypothetical protein sync_1955 [Synechococcus sp. CC9311]|nr:hypothetical protein sync_1955 [Synechococcus sp. CC9311]
MSVELYLDALQFPDTTILAVVRRLQALSAWISIRLLNRENEKIFLLSC